MRAFESDDFNFLEIYEMTLSMESGGGEGGGDLEGQDTAWMWNRSDAVRPTPGFCEGADVDEEVLGTTQGMVVLQCTPGILCPGDCRRGLPCPPPPGL